MINSQLKRNVEMLTPFPEIKFEKNVTKLAEIPLELINKVN